MKGSRQRGSVSIFLVIILVPCIVVCSIFVDLSRVKLSQGVADSAADLALNSLMTHFDKDLSEFYGMIASCQTIEQFYDETAKYFLEALHSQGLEQEAIDSLIAQYSAVVGDDSVYDLLQMELQSEEAKIVSEVPNASLGESSVILKDQIVDFMKYRGPIEILTGIVERLKNNNVASELEEASKNEELVKDKQEYTESLGDLLDASYRSYCCLMEYKSALANLPEWSQLLGEIQGYEAAYLDIHKSILFNHLNTEGLQGFTRPVISINKYSSTYTKAHKSVYSKKEKIDGTEHYYVEKDDILTDNGKKGIIVDMQSKIDEFNNKKAAVVNAAAENGVNWINKATGTGGDSVSEIQWWVKVDGLVNNGKQSPINQYADAADDMLKTYAIMSAMLDCEDSTEEGKEPPEGWRDTCKELQAQVKELVSKYLTADKKNDNDQYLKLVKKLEDISKGNSSRINPDINTISNGKTISVTASQVKSSLEGYQQQLETCVECLDKVIDGGGLFSKIKSLDKIKDLAEEYRKDFTQWENTANKINTSESDDEMADEDLKEINEERDKYGEINETSVTSLKNRLVKIRSKMKELVEFIDSLEYGNKKLTEHDSYSTILNALKRKMNSLNESLKQGLTNSELEQFAQALFPKVFQPSKQDLESKASAIAQVDGTNHPDLSKNTPELLKYWEDTFGGTDAEEEKVDEQKDKVDGAAGKGDSQSADILEKDYADHISEINIYGGDYAGDEFPSGLDAYHPYKLTGSVLDSISNLAKSFTSGSYTNIRDSLYTTEYVMDMFSYATYMNEGRNRLYMKSEEKNIKDSEAPINTEAINQAWESTELTDTYNKSLTGNMISTENNVAFGAEAEYVLYGNTNEKNIKSANADIYAIRYPLNLVSGFQNFWNVKGDNQTAMAIDSTAKAVFGLSHGIVPMALTKAVLIALLAVFETGNDITRLHNGLPVEIYKKEEDWRMTLNAWEPKGNGADKENTSGLYYSDYLYMFLYLGFESESASEMYLRVGDLMQANMRKATGNGDYVLKKARTYFQITATIRVKPLMLTLPYALQYESNPKDKTDWCTFDAKQIRGYS